MTPPASKPPPVVAVFGSLSHVDVALHLGAAIARAGATTLTGGDRPAARPVKHAAIQGAQQLRGRWVGVTRADDTDSHSQSADTFVFRVAVGHRRNYLEAFMCDAAVAIAGGDGTASEAMFSLYLGKPVVLVGDWAQFDPTTPSGLDSLVTASFRRVGTPSGRAALDSRIDESAIRKHLLGTGVGRCKLMSASDPPDQITNSLLTLLSGRQLGSFPDFLVEPECKAAGQAYRRWP